MLQQKEGVKMKDVVHVNEKDNNDKDCNNKYCAKFK